MTSTAGVCPVGCSTKGVNLQLQQVGAAGGHLRHGHDGPGHRVQVHPGASPPAVQQRPAPQPVHHGAGGRRGYGRQLDDDVVVELGAHPAGADDDHRADPRHLPGTHQQLDDAVAAVLFLQQVCALSQPGGHLREGGHGGGAVGEADAHAGLLGLVLQPHGLEHEGAGQVPRGGCHVLCRPHLPSSGNTTPAASRRPRAGGVARDRRARLRLHARDETGEERGELHRVSQRPAGPVDAVERGHTALPKERDARALRAHRVHQEGDPGRVRCLGQRLGDLDLPAGQARDVEAVPAEVAGDEDLVDLSGRQQRSRRFWRTTRGPAPRRRQGRPGCGLPPTAGAPRPHGRPARR